MGSLVKRFAIDIFHDHDMDSAVTADVMKQAEVGMTQTRDCTRFPLEADAIHDANEEFGLKLESTKGPAEALVIESLQKPSEN
jgi:uncharacterized protein (TIGR03435 family)